MIRKILASSPGWNWNEPTFTQSLAPLIVCPIPGSAGSIDSTIALIPKRYLYCSRTRKSRRSARRVSAKSPTPITIQRLCRKASSGSSR